MAEFPKMPLWTDAYLADTGHLTTTEHGAYLLLLMAMWRSKGTRLPSDDRALARMARLTASQWSRMKPTIMAFFKDEDGFITQGRLTDEATAVRQHRQKQSDRVKSRWLKSQGNVDTAVVPEPCRNDTSLSLSLSHKEDTLAAADPTPRECEAAAAASPGFHDQVLEAARIDVSVDVRGKWFSSSEQWAVRRWLEDLALTETEVLAEIRAKAAYMPRPPHTLRFFDGIMSEAAGRKIAPRLEPVADSQRRGRFDPVDREMAYLDRVIAEYERPLS